MGLLLLTFVVMLCYSVLCAITMVHVVYHNGHSGTSSS